MNRLLLFPLMLLIAVSCRDVAAPEEGEAPDGPYVVWFNGLSANADAFFESSDSLVTNAWSTGSAPNQIIALQNNRFAILSSISGDIRFYSGDRTGETEGLLNFPSGSNPWSFAIDGSTGYTTLLLSDSVSVFNTASLTITGSIPTDPNPSGIAVSSGKLFVSHANWPDASSAGGVSVIDVETQEQLGWIDTGENTVWLKMQPSGMLHCYSTTYNDDGKVSIVDPATLSVHTVVECGGAPGEAVFSAGRFLSPDGFGGGGLVEYTEDGAFNRIALPFAPTGLAVAGDVLYATCFGSGKIYLLDADTYTVLDSLVAGGEGPQGIIAVFPSN